MKTLIDKETNVIIAKAEHIEFDGIYYKIDNTCYQADVLNLEIADIGNADCEIQKHKYTDGKIELNEKYIEPAVIQEETIETYEELKQENIKLKAQIAEKEETIQSLNASIEFKNDMEGA